VRELACAGAREVKAVAGAQAPRLPFEVGAVIAVVARVVDEAIPAYIAWEDGTPEPTVELREQQVTISQLCGLLWNCHDILPSGAIFELDGCDADLKSQTYASAARWMKAECTRQLAKPERSVADIR